ncbi:hypothetical protein EB75_28150 [Mycobacterium sp. ST-F2]|nr:hypothetical protein EB75_28150 [Mycobacterium sp. ST-F2]
MEANTMTARNAGFDRAQHHYKDLKRKFRTECQERADDCWLCFRPIDYSLEYPHPESFSVDHAVTVKARPELADDYHNFRPAHLVCNQMRGDEEPHLDIGEPSEVW